MHAAGRDALGGGKSTPARRSKEPRAEPQACVLIVDDNEVNLLVAKSICELCGLGAVCVQDGMDAVKAVQTREFDLILMDICMPGMDGVEAATAIRQLGGRHAEVPIVAVTANAEKHEIELYLQSGMCEVVSKPVNVERLIGAMQRALGEGQEAETKEPEPRSFAPR